MTIRKKMLLINLIMLIIPLLALIAATVLFWEGAGVQYEESMESVLQDDKLMYSAQGYLHAYWEELRDQSGFPEMAGETAALENTDKMKRIEEKILRLGYHFQVSVMEQIYTSTLSESDKEILNQANESDRQEMELIKSNDGIVIIRQTFCKNDVNVRLEAIHTPDIKSMGKQESIWHVFIKYAVFAITLVGVSILFSNLILSFWVRKHIMIPLHELSVGSKKIKGGELDYKIGNEKQDEIGEVCRDFDEMSTRLKESEDARIRYEKDKAEILAGISHDLRSPLTSIKGYAEGLMEGIAGTPEKRRKYYKAIHMRAHDMEYLADSLGTYMGLDTGNYRFHKVKTELNTYLKEYVQKYANLTGIDEKLELCTSLTEEALYTEIDEEQMNRVLDNIIQNSIKYGGSEKIVIKIETERRENMGFLKIKDNGPGALEESLPYLFNCFYRADASRTKPGKGSGLGLSIVKKIIDGHGGFIRAENDDGLAVLIWLPLIKTEEAVNEKDINR